MNTDPEFITVHVSGDKSHQFHPEACADLGVVAGAIVGLELGVKLSELSIDYLEAEKAIIRANMKGSA